MNLASTKQGHPHSHIWFTGHHFDHILCFMQMANTPKKVNHVGVVFQFSYFMDAQSIFAEINDSNEYINLKIHLVVLKT
jgi:hypothetical protein